MPRKIGAFYLCYQNWLGRWFLVQTSEEDDEDIEKDIQELREVLKE